MNKKKIVVYVDGFNLYHGIKKLNKTYLKWLDLRSLAEKFGTKLTEGHIKTSLLPEMIKKKNGKIIHIPTPYKLPKSHKDTRLQLSILTYDMPVS